MGGSISISLAEYEKLLECRRRLDEYDARQRSLKTASKSPIERDLAVATLLADRLGVATIATAQNQCIAAFGQPRTPSKSAIQRYWARLRG